MPLRLHTLPLHQVRHEMDRFFSDLTRGLPNWPHVAPAAVRSFPAVNVWENDQELFAEAEVPGLKESDIDIFVVGNELTIKGERKPSEAQEVTYHRRERGAGTFTRVVHLPVDVDSSRVSATLRDGVLTVTLPKAETARPRKIQVVGSN
ncbi:MAG: Hsp20/alpha crystallin family protein [Pirellulales bacterium]|nr:Hsp20/alpha crystallin family protein [Pirellulales bacterium]